VGLISLLFKLKKSNKSLKIILTLYCLLLAGFSFAQFPARTIISLNNDWEFKKENAGDPQLKWDAVNLPHTWNTEDVMDDEAGYFRGIGVYKRSLVINEKLAGKELYLFFEGANQETQVFVNGKKAGDHIGGYSGFYIPVTHLIDFSTENELLVKVDNRHNENIPPLSADFTFYGGIYRDVWLVAVDRIHFSCNEEGSNSLYVSTPKVNRDHAEIQVKGTVTNRENEAKKITIKTIVYDKAKRNINSISQSVILEPGKNGSFVQPTISISNPKLWSPESPYLYTVVTEIRDASSNKLLDALTNPLGLRWFHFDAAKGFYLNGNPCKLIGTSRHQDYEGMGNAVPDVLARKDVELIKKMGGNFLRVAHYPQDPSVLAACDSLGILASVEIPIVNEISESDSFYYNSLRMQREMIKQHYNHPSLIIWCYMNEVLLRPRFNDDKERQKKYFNSISRLAKALDSLTRVEDPYRYTMMAHHGDYNKYKDLGLVELPMVVGWNLYSGWYGARIQDFPAFLDSFHKKHPGQPMLVSEYGADADPRIRSLTPVRFDKSVEYTTEFHQYYLEEMMKRPFVAAAMIWNLADFNSETRTESMPHINNKGLLEWDRTPKDPYYFYQAMLSKNAFVRILNTKPATGVVDSNGTFSMRTLQVATNLTTTELFINGRSAGKKSTTSGLGEWKIPFINGSNEVEVVGQRNGKTYKDKARIQFVLLSSQLKNDSAGFHPLNVLLGAKRYFTDSEEQLWIPDQVYHKGSWGHIGGKDFKIPGNARLPYGTDKNILGTSDDPIYQTQQVGIDRYVLDVPAGKYDLTLHFAELQGGIAKGLPYNLSDPDRIEPNGKRIFDVYINGKLVLDSFDISKEHGTATAIAKTIQITIGENKGIEVRFKAIEGEPVLNALQLKRVENRSTIIQVSTEK
jgi:beta-galactosidase